MEGYISVPVSLSFSPDGSTLAVCIVDILLWNVASSQEKATLRGQSMNLHFLTFSPDGRTLASGGYDGVLRLWDVASGQQTTTFRGHEDWVTSVKFSPDGSILASGGEDHTVRLWDVVSGQEKAALRGHTGDVFSVSFSPDGRILASGSQDSTIVLWNLAPRFNPETANADFDGNGAVDFVDFLQFAENFGLNQGDAGYDAEYDLDGDGAIGFGDFLIFARAFGRLGGHAGNKLNQVRISRQTTAASQFSRRQLTPFVCELLEGEEIRRTSIRKFGLSCLVT